MMPSRLCYGMPARSLDPVSIANEVQSRPGAKPFDLSRAERMTEAERFNGAVGTREAAFNRRRGRYRGQAEQTEAVVLADTFVVRVVLER